MALADDVTDSRVGQLIASSSSSINIQIDRGWAYGVRHTGKVAAGTADTNIIVIGTDGAAKTADWSVETDKIVLEAGDSVILPARITGALNHADAEDVNKAVITIRSAANAPLLEFIKYQVYGGR